MTEFHVSGYEIFAYESGFTGSVTEFAPVGECFTLPAVHFASLGEDFTLLIVHFACV